MFSNLKKKFNNPNLLSIVYLVATLIVIIERFCSFLIMLDSPDAKYLRWNGLEYTLAFLLPLAFFGYSYSSKFCKNISNRLKVYTISAVLLLLILAIMIGQISNSVIWYILLKGFGEDAIEIAKIEFPSKLYSAVIAGSLYFLILSAALFLNYFIKTFYSNDSADQIVSGISPTSFRTPCMVTGEFTCQIKICKDDMSGSDIIIPENRRMEATLIQGATGTGKTSTLMLPMCARDIEKKFLFAETGKQLALEALEKGYAYINVPLSNDELNKTFTLNYISPVKGKESEFNDLFKDLIKITDKSTGKNIYKNLGISVVEPDGKYINDFKKVAQNYGMEVLTIDPDDPNSFGMNPFDNERPDKVASIISTVLKAMYEADNPGGDNVFFGQVTQQALENLAILLKVMYPRMNDGLLPTLEDMLKMLYDYNMVERMCEEMKKYSDLKEEYKILIKYFERNFYAPPQDLNGRQILGTVGGGRRATEQFLYGATTNLDNLMRHDRVKDLLCARKNNIDFDSVLADGKLVAVCTRRGELGGLLARPFGMFYILSMQDAVLRRPGNERTRTPHFLYIDEFPDFVNKETETCFTLFRKYRCAMIVAIQNLSQLSRTKAMKFYREVVISNTKTHLIFGDTNKEDSLYWADVFGKDEIMKISHSMKGDPLSQVKTQEAAEGSSKETYGISMPFLYRYRSSRINQLPFKSLMYSFRDSMGDIRKGVGKTDFLEEKYTKTHTPAYLDFNKYIALGTPEESPLSLSDTKV